MSDTESNKQQRIDEHGTWEIEGAFEQLMEPTEEFEQSRPPIIPPAPSEIDILKKQNSTLQQQISDMNQNISDFMDYIFTKIPE